MRFLPLSGKAESHDPPTERIREVAVRLIRRDFTVASLMTGNRAIISEEFRKESRTDEYSPFKAVM